VAPVINIPAVRVRQPNLNIKVPKYNPFKKTATAYLEEVEAFLKNQGAVEAEFLELVPTVLEDHTISWFRSKKVAAYTWAQFKTDFEARYDNTITKQLRQNHLVTRKQRDDEPVETFVWEMMDLSKQVFPGETIAESVERCRNALHPRLKVAVGELTTSTAEHLIDRCQAVIQDLRALDRVEGRRSKLPPMHTYSNDRFKHKPHFQSSTSSFVNNRPPGNWNRGQSSTNQGQSGGQQSTSQTNQQQPSSSGNAPNAYGQRQHFRMMTRGTYRRPASQNGNRNQHAEKTCYQCKKPGHIAAQCPATAFYLDNAQGEEVVDPAHQNTEDLNGQGGHQQ